MVSDFQRRVRCQLQWWNRDAPLVSHKLVLALFIFLGFGGRCPMGVSQCKASRSLVRSLKLDFPRAVLSVGLPWSLDEYLGGCQSLRLISKDPVVSDESKHAIFMKVCASAPVCALTHSTLFLFAAHLLQCSW